MNKKNFIAASIIVLLLVSGFYYWNADESNLYPDDPPFTKEGTLSFYSNDDKKKIQIIDIEIAESRYERNQGLMHRHHMDKDQGMLFIYKQSQQRGFWMKNTHISLDIIYLDQTYKIVSIQERAEPLSEKQLPSGAKAKYVVEVVAGYCKKHSITIGDYITYNRI